MLVAPLPPPPDIVIVGVDVYSLPGFVTVMPVTAPLAIEAVAVAP